MSKSSIPNESGSGGGAGVVEASRLKDRPSVSGQGRMTDDITQPIGRGDPSTQRHSFFEIYKPSQGKYTRLGTAVGGGILIAGAGNFLYDELGVFRSELLWTLLLQVLVPLILAVVSGFVLYWIVGVNRTCCDFFIATEGEMKKVSWSNRNELIGSTKVVIAATILLALILFIVDAMFIKFFQAIDVLWSQAQS